MANLLNELFLGVQGHAVMFVQVILVYAKSVIGERIMNIKKWEIWRKVNSSRAGKLFYTLQAPMDTH